MERRKLNAWDGAVQGKGKLDLRLICATKPYIGAAAAVILELLAAVEHLNAGADEFKFVVGDRSASLKPHRSDKARLRLTA